MLKLPGTAFTARCFQRVKDGANTSPLVLCVMSVGLVEAASLSHPITCHLLTVKTSHVSSCVCPFSHLFGNMSAYHYGDADEQQKNTVENL